MFIILACQGGSNQLVDRSNIITYDNEKTEFKMNMPKGSSEKKNFLTYYSKKYTLLQYCITS